MIKLLIGGSPCTYWSIAQKNNRETEAEGMGWELFKNYLIAKEKFNPDFFLYENNVSAAKPIKEQIKKELHVNNDDNQLSSPKYIEINSALVSAQNRRRFYVHNLGDVKQPEDRGILLRDILEMGESEDISDKGIDYMFRTVKGGRNHFDFGYTFDATKSKSPCLTTGASRVPYNVVIEPIKVGLLPTSDGQLKDHQHSRIYSVDGKSTTQNAQGGGLGAKTGLYAIPAEYNADVKDGYIQYDISEKGYKSQDQRAYFDDGKHPPLMASSTESKTGVLTQCFNSEKKPIQIYKVKDGLITIKDKQYPIKLADGYYVIRKLTVKECCRLQTMPDDYCRAVSNTQAYKGLGNGWTAEVIIHLLDNALHDIPRDEEIVVLSMYDGIGTGRYCLDKMGFTNVKYYAYEIDKYAMQVSMSNYPDIIQCGDAFQVREGGWEYDKVVQ